MKTLASEFSRSHKSSNATVDKGFFNFSRKGFGLILGGYVAILVVIAAIIAITEGFDWLQSTFSVK